MKENLKTICCLLLLLLISIGEARSQVVDINKWKGTYPEMNGTYPLSFVAFKGKIIPVPHVFVRSWPTHYYVEVGALPVTDSPELTGRTQTGLLRIAAKMLERHQMKGRHDETQLIKNNAEFQKQIEQKIFNSRSERLEDLFRLAQAFIKLFEKVDSLEQLRSLQAVKRIYEKEADQLLMRFLMVNLFQSDPGEKLQAFSEISTTLNQLIGEVDYAHSKIQYFSNYDKELMSYSFLTQ